MKININSKELQKKVQAASGVIGQNPLIPILENVLIESDGETIKLTGSDLHTTAITTINLKAEKGSFCIPSKLLLDVLKNLPDSPIELEMKQTLSEDGKTKLFNTILKSGKSKYKIACENPSDFPLPKVSEGKEIVISSDILLNAINTISWACSSDDFMPEITGMLFQGNGTELNFVATDTRKLIEIVNDINGIEINAIVGKKQLNVLKSVLSFGLDVSVFVSDKNISFKFGEIEIIGQLIDEKYPTYRNAIPTNDKNLEVNKQDLINSIKRVSLFSNKENNMVKFSINESELAITSEDTAYNNEGLEIIDVVFLHHFEIGVNSKHLLEILQHVKGDVITMSFSEPNRAILIKGSAENELFLNMPVMLNK